MMLDEIEDMAFQRKVRPPAVLVVGGVVDLRDSLNWFEKKPLFGKRILVTRARHQAKNLIKRLGELGAEAILRLEVEDFPAIVINDIFGGDLYQEGKAKYKIDRQ